MMSLLLEHGKQCMPCSTNISVTLQAEILSTETSDFLKQIIILKSFSFFFYLIQIRHYSAGRSHFLLCCFLVLNPRCFNFMLMVNLLLYCSYHTLPNKTSIVELVAMSAVYKKFETMADGFSVHIFKEGKVGIW